MSAGPWSYDELLDRVRGLVTSLDRPPVVAICGHGGAGKTTLPRRLADDVGVCWEQVVRADACGGAGRGDPRDPRRDAAAARPRGLDRPRPETAGERAKARNVLQGDSREELDLWDWRWVPEGRASQRAVRPEQLAHLVVAAAGRD